ncbi:MAG: AAA family ATPase [Planctomycetota bacterium]
MNAPVCTIIAGPNGAGKTTFALTYLPQAADCRNFVNADLIASGLSPLAPERELIAAGRLFLGEIRRFVDARASFAFETTLAGKSYLKLIRQLLADDWLVELMYLWLPSVEVSRQRVAERVAHGGHDIPSDAIKRRYPRSIANLLNHYAPLCSSTICFNNSESVPELIFTESAAGRVVENAELYAALERGALDD